MDSATKKTLLLLHETLEVAAREVDRLSEELTHCQAQRDTARQERDHYQCAYHTLLDSVTVMEDIKK